MKDLLEKSREINKFVLEVSVSGYPIRYEEIAETLSKIINVNVCIVNQKGNVWGNVFIDDLLCQNMNDINYLTLSNNIDEILSKSEILSNIKINNCLFKNGNVCVFR